jgi:hypothetical protein
MIRASERRRLPETQTKTKTITKTIRCAIYTRKSSEDGLEQEFNSLDAQRESGRSLYSQPGLRGLGLDSGCV